MVGVSRVEFRTELDKTLFTHNGSLSFDARKDVLGLRNISVTNTEVFADSVVLETRLYGTIQIPNE